MLGSVHKQTITHTILWGASKFKTTSTVERKSGLIITTKMCEVWVWQLFLVNKPYDFIVWLAFLGQGLNPGQALIKGIAFLTKWRAMSLFLTLLPCSDPSSQMKITLPIILRLRCIEDAASKTSLAIFGDRIQLTGRICDFPKTQQQIS